MDPLRAEDSPDDPLTPWSHRRPMEAPDVQRRLASRQPPEPGQLQYEGAVVGLVVLLVLLLALATLAVVFG